MLTGTAGPSARTVKCKGATGRDVRGTKSGRRRHSKPRSLATSFEGRMLETAAWTSSQSQSHIACLLQAREYRCHSGYEQCEEEEGVMQGVAVSERGWGGKVKLPGYRLCLQVQCRLGFRRD